MKKQQTKPTLSLFLLKSDDWLSNSDLTKRWKFDYNFHVKIKQTNCIQNKFILSTNRASSNCQDYVQISIIQGSLQSKKQKSPWFRPTKCIAFVRVAIFLGCKKIQSFHNRASKPVSISRRLHNFLCVRMQTYLHKYILTYTLNFVQ